jgi:hypothetical protein
MIGKTVLWVGALVLHMFALVGTAYIGAMWAFWFWSLATVPALLLG